MQYRLLILILGLSSLCFAENLPPGVQPLPPLGNSSSSSLFPPSSSSGASSLLPPIGAPSAGALLPPTSASSAGALLPPTSNSDALLPPLPSSGAMTLLPPTNSSRRAPSAQATNTPLFPATPSQTPASPFPARNVTSQPTPLLAMPGIVPPISGASAPGSTPVAVSPLDGSPLEVGANSVTDQPSEDQGEPEISIILSENRFYPSKIQLRDGQKVRLIFTTINPKPAALIVQDLNIQKWVGRDETLKPATESDRARWELTREIGTGRLTAILIEARHGNYTFHDVLSGASGEISVE